MAGKPKKYKHQYIPPDVAENLDYIKRIWEQKAEEVKIFSPKIKVTYPNLLRVITNDYIKNEKKKKSL